MNRILKHSLVILVLMNVYCQTAQAAKVKVHWTTEDPNRVWLKVYKTIDCEIIHPPLFDGWIYTCTPEEVEIPADANDFMVKMDWDHWCNNRDHHKTAQPVYDGTTNQWQLQDLGQWIDDNAEIPLVLPSIGDDTGVIQDVYVMVNLGEWLADPRPLLDTYAIVDGASPDLPGYLIGTTPIVFNPDAGPDENPFSTTPLTGALVGDAEVTYSASAPIPTVSEWGLIVMTLLMLTVATVALGRRRQPVAA